jgi:hypothetical protein
MMHVTQLLLQYARSIPPPVPSPMPYTSPSLSPHPHPPIHPQHLPFNLNPTLQAAIARSLAAGQIIWLYSHCYALVACVFVLCGVLYLLGENHADGCSYFGLGKDTHRSLSLDVLQARLPMLSLRNPAPFPTFQLPAPAAFLNLLILKTVALMQPLQTDIGARALKNAKFVLLFLCVVT